MTLFDIIYVNYNSTDCLINSIESLREQDQAGQLLNIIVVDNHSDDNVHRLDRLFPQITLILNNENRGFGAAINQALMHCYSDFSIFLNPDSMVTLGFIETCFQFMEQNEKIGIMGPRIIDRDGGIQGSARTFPTPLTSLFGRNSPITKLFPNNSITKSNILTWRTDNQTPIEVDWVSGACMAVRREAMLEVGGFDERFFLYWEDSDLCRRIRDAGWKVIYFPQAKVIHSVGKSSGTRPIFANYQFHKSCYRLYEKYVKWPFSIISPVAGIALMLRFLAAVIFYYISGVISRIRFIEKLYRTKKVKNKGKIRILRVISRMNIGGPSIHIKNLAEGLNQEKFETKVIAGSLSPNEGDMSYLIDSRKGNIDRIAELQRELNPVKDFIALFKILKTIKRFNPDIVHSHLSKAGTLSRIAAFLCNVVRSKKIKMVHTFHGHVLEAYFGKVKSLFLRNVEKTLARLTDRIIAISYTQKWELSQKYKITDSSKICLINLGFNLIPFVHASKLKGKLRQKIDVSNDTLLIGIVGRLAKVKNHKMFLDAAVLFLNNHNHAKVKFVLVGDGELRETLENYVVEAGLNDNVIFYGWEKNIPMIYADLDILALTSLNEGTPVSIIEAMAASVPVITTGVGGIKDILGHIEADQPDAAFKICERGILCPKNDSIAFSNALKFIIDSNYLLEKNRFTTAREYVLKSYSIERLLSDVETLYGKLLNTG